MGRVVYHVYSHASPPTILFQPFVIFTVWTPSHLGKHKGQHCKGSSPEVILETMKFTRSFKSIFDHALLEFDVPRKQDEEILNIGCWYIPHPVVTFNFVCVREVYIYSSYDKGFSSQLSDAWNFVGENSFYSGLTEFL